MVHLALPLVGDEVSIPIWVFTMVESTGRVAKDLAAHLSSLSYYAASQAAATTTISLPIPQSSMVCRYIDFITQS